MARFKESDITQGQFIAVNLSEQLIPGTFEWTLNYLIERMDLSLFKEKYNNDEKGASAYQPKALLKIILYCYNNGILSSRRMEKACKTNIIVKTLAGDGEPDHATIATFISTNSEEVKDLFVKVLMQCQELNLITGEMVAIDGCKISSNASKEWSGTIEHLKKRKARLEKYVKKIINRHKELDKNNDVKRKQKKYKKTMGDDKERRQRHVDRIEKKLKRLNEFLAEAEPKMGANGKEIMTNVTDPQSAKIKGPHGYIQGYNAITVADSKNQVILCTEAIGFGSESGSFPKMLNRLEENMKKITGKKEPLKDILLEGDTGYFSEENLQEAQNKGIEVIIPDPYFRMRDNIFEERNKTRKKPTRYTAEDFKYNERKNCYTCPWGKILSYKGRVKLRNNEGDKYMASSRDCGICPLAEKCLMKSPRRKEKRRQNRTPKRTLYITVLKHEENLSEKMRKKIDDPAFRELYSRRQQIIEPVFANITRCKGMDRFTLRTAKKINIQWHLYCIVHNIGKCVKPIEEKIRSRWKNKRLSGLLYAT